jgi:uncharacterized protein
MTLQSNKQVVCEFFARFSNGDVTGVLDLMTEDATWRIPGKPGSAPMVGVRSKPQMARVFQGMIDRLKNGVEMTVKTLTAEDDRVAVELESHALLQNDRVYANEYHLLMTIYDGKVREVHEYYDTQHVLETWFTP